MRIQWVRRVPALCLKPHWRGQVGPFQHMHVNTDTTTVKWDYHSVTEVPRVAAGRFDSAQSGNRGSAGSSGRSDLCSASDLVVGSGGWPRAGQ